MRRRERGSDDAEQAVEHFYEIASEEQRAALERIVHCMQHGKNAGLVGGPGTGKTRVGRTAIRIGRAMSMRVVSLADSKRAAENFAEGLPDDVQVATINTFFGLGLMDKKSAQFYFENMSETQLKKFRPEEGGVIFTDEVDKLGVAKLRLLLDIFELAKATWSFVTLGDPFQILAPDHDRAPKDRTVGDFIAGASFYYRFYHGDVVELTKNFRHDDAVKVLLEIVRNCDDVSAVKRGPQTSERDALDKFEALVTQPPMDPRTLPEGKSIVALVGSHRLVPEFLQKSSDAAGKPLIRSASMLRSTWGSVPVKYRYSIELLRRSFDEPCGGDAEVRYYCRMCRLLFRFRVLDCGIFVIHR